MSGGIGWRAAVMAVLRNECGLFELVGDLVEPGLDAGLVLVAAGRARDAGRADHLVADLDRQRALRCDDAREVHRAGGRVVLDPLHELARGDAESARGVGLTLAVL